MTRVRLILKKCHNNMEAIKKNCSEADYSRDAEIQKILNSDGWLEEEPLLISGLKELEERIKQLELKK